MYKEIPFDVMKEIIPKHQLRNKIKNGEFKGQIPADFNIEKHTPKLHPKQTWDGAPIGLSRACNKYT